MALSCIAKDAPLLTPCKTMQCAVPLSLSYHCYNT